MENIQPFGHKIIEVVSVDSTNSYALRSFDENQYEEGTIIITPRQFAGKGLGTNFWESAPGKNLTFSCIIRPEFLSPQHQFMLNKFVSLAVYDFICEMLPCKAVKIKWPNDIYIDNDKACGILINNTIKGNTFDYCVLGIGLNINQTVFISDAPNPVSLKNISGIDYDLDICMNRLLSLLTKRYAELKSGQVDLLNEAYLNALYRYGRPGMFRKNKQVIKASISGITEYGKLILKDDAGNVTEYDFKEVEFVH